MDRLEDGQIADASMAMQQLAAQAAFLSEDLLVQLLENGQSTLCYDGQNFFDTDHPTDIDAVTGTQRNYHASGLALDATNLNTVLTAMMGYRGENGRPMRVVPNLLIVPPALYKTAVDLVEVKTVTNGGENSFESKYNLRVVVLKRAASATRWWVADTQSPGPKPAILQVRKAPTFVAKTAPSDEAMFLHNEAQFGVDARMGLGPGLWQRIYSASA
jgi:phage major head subunit gpT-like protein